MVNSAGAPWKPQDVTEIEPAHLRRVLAAEIEATYYLLRAALPGMRERGWGRFVSIGGHMADDWRFGPPDAPLDYPLGKAARHWLTRTLAPREAPHGITINAVAPGPTERLTPAEADAAARGESDATRPYTAAHRRRRGIPVLRCGRSRHRRRHPAARRSSRVTPSACCVGALGRETPAVAPACTARRSGD